MQAQSQTHTKHPEDDLSDDLLDAFEASLGDLGADAEEGGRQISLKRHILTVKSNSGCVEKIVGRVADWVYDGQDATVLCHIRCSPDRP